MDKMNEIMLVIDRPHANDILHLNRAEKHKLLKNNSKSTIEEISVWIEEERLESQVEKIYPPTVFNLLFMICTPNVAEKLQELPFINDIHTLKRGEL